MSFFFQRAEVLPGEPVQAPDGTILKYHDRRPTSYFSVFGKIQFRRPYFHTAGKAGICPLDAELSLPPNCYSYLLVDWANYCAVNEAYNEAISVLERILGIRLSKQALETGVDMNALEVDSFYEQKPIVCAKDEGTIMVVQVDGKGVPMKREEGEVKPARLGKGEKRGIKKEAVVTAIYTIEPYERTPEDLLYALLPDLADDSANNKDSKLKRPVPVAKEVRATMDGKDVAFEYLTGKVDQREGNHIKQRVALTDGAGALQDRVIEYFPSFTLVLDIIHTAEYLWDAANAYLGEKHPERTQWVGTQLLEILSGRTEGVIATLEGILANRSLSKAREKLVRKAAGYYRGNLPYMQYDQYLRKGWPIGTGVVEGACGHLVKDRMEGSGMRWTKQGAQSVLDIRAARLNKDWDDYQQHYRIIQHHRLYGFESNPPPIVENNISEKAA